MTDDEIKAAFAQPTPEMDALAARYESATHAMQSGVAMEMNDPDRRSATDPKHLRVGVNSALVETSALAQALMRKGVLTPIEYFSAIVEKMEEEVRSYEARINSKHEGGPRVRLG